MPPLPPVFRAGPSLTLSETLLVAGRKSLGRPVCTTPGEFAPNQPPAATTPPPAPASARTRLLNLVLDPLCSAPIPPCVAGRFGAYGMLAPGVERRAECDTAPLGVLGVLDKRSGRCGVRGVTGALTALPMTSLPCRPLTALSCWVNLSVVPPTDRSSPALTPPESLASKTFVELKTISSKDPVSTRLDTNTAAAFARLSFSWRCKTSLRFPCSDAGEQLPPAIERPGLGDSCFFELVSC